MGPRYTFCYRSRLFQGIDAAVDALLVEVKGCHYLFEIAVLRTIKTF